jgi:release factor H-coupled RctB family protein
MGTLPITARSPKVRVIASPSTWIEGEALRQLDATAALPGMLEAVGMPDLHPGKGSPVGAAFLADAVLYPALVGSDIGCGMALWQTSLTLRRAHPDKIATRLEGLDAPWDGDTVAWLEERGLEPTPHDAALGTIGHGNHFAELQAVHTVVDEAAFARLGLDAGFVQLLVHSGSRGLGEAVLRRHTERFRADGVAEGSEGAQAYLEAHDRAVRWARANRDLIAHRVLGSVGAEGRPVLDVCHNAVTPLDEAGCRCWLHGKGAAPADQGPLVIPGSRGDVSVLVEPLRDRREGLWSLAHGAGRKLARHEAKGKLKGRYRRADLERNPFGGIVVCGDDNLLWEEAPEAYKPAEAVVGDLVAVGLCRVIAVMRPLVTFKCSRERHGEDRREKQERLRQRKVARAHKREEHR